MIRVRAFQLALVGGAIVALEALCRAGIIDRFAMIPPSEMLLALAGVMGTEPWFWPDVSYTLGNLAAAIGLSVAGGFLIGLVVHAIPRLRRVLDPIFTSYYSVPTFVLYPLLIVFFGIGPASLIVLGALFGIVAMIVATMTAIDRTAYPRPGTRLTREELGMRYDLTEADLAFVRVSARGDTGRLVLATLLKARRDLGCFPALEDVHSGILTHLAVQLGLAVVRSSFDELRRTKSLYRYQAAVRLYLSVTAYGDAAELLVKRTVLEAAETMSDPADLINQAVETLQAASIDLPAFSTLDRLVNRLRTEVHARIYNRVLVRVTAEHLARLDALLVKPANSTTTSFNRLKQTPGPATPTTIRLWLERLDWLAGLIDPDPLLEGVARGRPSAGSRRSLPALR